MKNAERWLMFVTIALLIVGFIVYCVPASAQMTVESENQGWALQLPEGWHVEAYPKGYNTGKYDPVENPFGKEGGRWPLYEQVLKESGCVEEGEIDFSPSIPCPPRPRFIVTQSCYYEPEPPICDIDFSPLDPRCID